ncbi:MAG: ATPase, T2SS/T4P/T4SS family, partial [Myxococcota bacterium]
MLKIDFYVQHLVRHNATGIELVSGNPVKFIFPTGDRQSNKPIEHNQIAALVQEAAPPAALEALRSSGRAEFFHKSAAGMDVRVELSAAGPGTWRVRLTPSAGGAPQQRTSLPDAAPAAARPAPKPASAPKAQVESVPGEPEINRYLRLMVAKGASDLHLSSDVPAMARIDGTMQILEPGSAKLTPDHLLKMLMEITPEPNREEYEETNDTDYAHTIEGVARFRANIFTDRKGPGGVFRQIPFDILSVEQIGIPEKVLDLCWLSKGLVLVTGPTGSGKSTTLATLIDYINQNREEHIITIEDPIEFVHDNKKCLVNQREIGTHT